MLQKGALPLSWKEKEHNTDTTLGETEVFRFFKKYAGRSREAGWVLARLKNLCIKSEKRQARIISRRR